MNKLSVEQCNYLAGFIDGDGSIVAQIVPREDYVLKYQVRVSVLFIQKSKRIHFLQQFQKEMGLGILRPDRNEKKNLDKHEEIEFDTLNLEDSKGIGDLTITGKNDVYALLKQLQPYLRIKKKQANLVMRICEQMLSIKNNPLKFLELCELADQVAALNDSKNRKTTVATVRNTLINEGIIEK